MNRRSLRPAAALLALLAGAARAAPDAALDQEAVEEQAVEVATRTPLTARRAPSIVTVMDRDEIENAGARDLLGLLMLVPGFSAAVDVSGVVDVGFRGLWAHEGKVLFLLDGQELNETLYSTMQLVGRIPVDLVERIEVSRGPGSAVYGGYAELAVISVVTRRPQERPGASASVEYGHMNQAPGHTAATASWAGAFDGAPGLAGSLSLAYGEGAYSTSGSYQDFAGASYPMRSNSGFSDVLADLGLQYGGLHLRAIYDDSRLRARDGNGPVLPGYETNRFGSSLVELKYAGRPAPGITITPRVSYKLQTPWQTTDRNSPLYYDKSAGRLLGGLVLTWNPIDELEILAGVDAFWDHATLNQDGQADFRGSSSVDHRTGAAYGQVLFRNPVADLILGARYEYNDATRGSFVPRVGLTKIVGRFNFKLLYSQAYRAPGIENLNINPEIRPERTDIVEAEAGVQFGGHVALVTNGYWIRLQRPIVYDVDPATNAETYLNGDRTGSTGAETQLRMKYAWGFSNLSYSFYTAAGQNRIGLYAVPGREDLLLGFPAHKVALNGGVHLSRSVVLGANGVLMSPRYGYVRGDDAGDPVLGSEPTLLLLGASLAYHDVATRGIDLLLGIQNLLDREYRVLQPYDGGHAPLPMAGREVFIRLAYRQDARRD